MIRYAAPILLLTLATACAKTNDPAPTCPRGNNCPAAETRLRAHDLRHGPHGMQGSAGPMGPMGPGGGCILGTGSLPDEAQKAIARALADERRAESEYAELANQTPSFPLGRIARSEVRHALELERLLVAHAEPVPPVAPAPPAPRAEDARAACAIGVASEKRNIALYDELLSASLPSDVRCVFERLRARSATHHLPAFERCAAR